jgi:hypothetical protein
MEPVAVQVIACARSNRYFVAGLALALCQEGRTDEAREVFDSLAAKAFDDITVNAAWLPTLTMFAKATALLGDRVAGRALLDKLVPFRNQIVAPVGMPWGCVAQHAALAATAAERLDEAAALFDEAEATHTRLGMTFMAERTRTERARWLG